MKVIFLAFLGACFALTITAIVGGLRIVVVPAVSFAMAQGTLVVFNAQEFRYLDTPAAMCARKSFAQKGCEEIAIRELSKNVVLRLPFSPWLHEFATAPPARELLSGTLLRG